MGHGRCFQISGPADTIKMMCSHAPPHVASRIEDGPCSSDNCPMVRHRDGVTMKVCGEGAVEDPVAFWELGGDTFHAVTPNGEACVQLRGSLMANSQVEEAVATKLSQKGMTLEAGACATDGFGTQYQGFHKDIHGISITIWMH